MGFTAVVVLLQKSIALMSAAFLLSLLLFRCLLFASILSSLFLHRRAFCTVVSVGAILFLFLLYGVHVL